MKTKNYYFLIDCLKVLAALLIILHHLSSYGQVAEDARLLFPRIMTWLFEYGRYAVQIFLVMGGYLASQSLVKSSTKSGGQVFNQHTLLKVILNRYFRLFAPYIVALMVTIACAWCARFWVQDEFVGESETLGQFLSHLFFLQGILGFDSISAGVWYVAIDWQLYTFLAIMLALLPTYRSAIWFITILVIGSLLYFNRHSEYESFFVYFIGSYGLGVLAHFAGSKYDQLLADVQTQRLSKLLILAVGLVIVVSSLYEIWMRNFLAFFVAIILLFWGNCSYIDSKNYKWQALMRMIAWASHRSYCAFLIHFSFILLANTIYIACGLSNKANEGTGVYAFGMMSVALIASWFTANYLYRFIEVPARRIKWK